MAATARKNAQIATTEALHHANTTAQDEIAAAEAAVTDPAGDDDRITIGLGQITELLQQIKSPADTLGVETVARLKAAGAEMWKASLGMSAHDMGRRKPAYEYDGRVIVRTMGRFLQSQARVILTQAYYSLRQAVRESKRFDMLDTTMRLARQTSYHIDRPGAAEDGVSDAPWIDGDDAFDPTKKQGDLAGDALMEALPFVAAAFIFCAKVPGLTDDEPITAKVKAAAVTERKVRPQTMADRMRAAPATNISTFLEVEASTPVTVGAAEAEMNAAYAAKRARKAAEKAAEADAAEEAAAIAAHAARIAADTAA
jgi:hypothetical protein